MFNLNDRVSYPGHGIAKVTRIINKIIGGNLTTFYELKFINKDMTILVPTNHNGQSGMRPLCSTESINDIFKFLAQPAKKLRSIDGMSVNWKQRNKEYQLKLRTGNLRDISEIYHELKHIATHKTLSFCEKNLLNQTEALLAEEIALVKKLEEKKALEYLRSTFSTLSIHTHTILQKTF